MATAIETKKEELAKAYEAEVESIRKDLEPGEQRIAEAKAAYEQVVKEEEQKARDGRKAIYELQVEIADLRGTARPSRPGGRPASNGTRAKRGTVPDVTATEAALLKFMEKTEGPVRAADIREGLSIPEGVPSNKVSKFLAQFVESNKLVKTGEKAGTRYELA